MKKETEETTKKTTVRGLSKETIKKYKMLAAERTLETGDTVSMNSLYVVAIGEYLEREAENCGS
jgi:hypothetical protein